MIIEDYALSLQKIKVLISNNKEVHFMEITT